MNKDDLVKKWLNDELTDAEMEAFKKLDDYQLHLDILNDAKYFKASQFSKAEEFEAFKKKYESQNTSVKSLNWTHYILRIAGVFIFAFGIYFTFFFNSITEIQTLASQKSTFELPDTSIVTLNADSEVAFYARNWTNNRHIKLNGEAYFKVAKGKTFAIKTDDGLVTITGTQFNVKQRKNYFEVQCFEGSVRVVSDSIERQLTEGNIFKVLNGKFTEGVVANKEPFWTKNISQFKALPFANVVAELERQFNVKIELRKVDGRRLFTGGFGHDDLEKALVAITQPMNLAFKMNASNSVVIHDKKD